MADHFVLRWAKIAGGQIVRSDMNLPKFDEDTPREVGITEATANACGWFKIANADPPKYDHDISVIRECPTVTLKDGVPTADWGLRMFSPEEAAAALAVFNANQQRLRRAALAAEYDPEAFKMFRGEI